MAAMKFDSMGINNFHGNFKGFKILSALHWQIKPLGVPLDLLSSFNGAPTPVAGL